MIPRKYIKFIQVIVAYSIQRKITYIIENHFQFDYISLMGFPFYIIYMLFSISFFAYGYVV